MTHRLILTLCSLAAFAPAAVAQVAPYSPVQTSPGGRTEGVVLASGSSATQVSIATVTLGATNPTPVTALAGLTLLPIHLAQGTVVRQFSSLTGGIVDVGSEITALELPGNAGARVFHYRRTGTTTFGFFSIDAGGAVRVLVERTGVGPGSNLDPFEAIVAAARDGQTIAIAARHYSQGIGGLGDAWLARADGPAFAGGAFAVEVTGSGKQTVEPHSLTFKDSWLYASVESALARAPADGSGTFKAIALPPTGGTQNFEVMDEFALSDDGSTLAFLAGADEHHVDLYVVDANGVAKNITQAQSDIQPPNYLPDEIGGPQLALSVDGAFVTFDRELANGHELFVRATQPGVPEVQLTSDANFEESIDTVSGVLFGAGRLRFLADSGLANADLYQVDLGAPAPKLSNVTQTSGAAVPFFPNTATINATANWALGADQLIVNDTTSPTAGIDLWRVDAADAAHVVAANLVTQPSVVAPVGARTHFVVRADAASSSTLFFAQPNAGWFKPFVSLPNSIPLEAVAVNRVGSRVALAADYPAGVRWVALMHPLTQQTTLVGGSPIAGARDLAFTTHGRLLLVADAAGGLVQPIAADAATGAVTTVGGAQAFAAWLR